LGDKSAEDPAQADRDEAVDGDDEEEVEAEVESSEEPPRLCHSSFDVYSITDRIFICHEHLDKVPEKATE